MKNKEEPRMKWSDDEYEAMIDLATRQLAERMAERALMTYEIYKYDYLGSQFVADFIADGRSDRDNGACTMDHESLQQPRHLLRNPRYAAGGDCAD